MENTRICEFGRYPKSLKKEDVIIIKEDVDDDGYYLGSDSERYHLYKGDYFKVEPVEWEVRFEYKGKYLLCTKYVIDLYEDDISDEQKMFKDIFPLMFERDERSKIFRFFDDKKFLGSYVKYINDEKLSLIKKIKFQLNPLKYGKDIAKQLSNEYLTYPLELEIKKSNQHDRIKEPTDYAKARSNNALLDDGADYFLGKYVVDHSQFSNYSWSTTYLRVPNTGKTFLNCFVNRYGDIDQVNVTKKQKCGIVCTVLISE